MDTWILADPISDNIAIGYQYLDLITGYPDLQTRYLDSHIRTRYLDPDLGTGYLVPPPNFNII